MSDKALSPLATIVVAALFLVLGGAVYWAYANASEVPRLTHLRLDPEGRPYALLGTELHRFDREGAHIAQIDLTRLGVYSQIGGFGFFANGDLLVRQGGDDRSFWFNLQRYLRHTNTTPDTGVPGAEGGLIRCNLASGRCLPFGDPPLHLNDAFHLEVDWSSDRVFLAASSRHRIQEFAPSGQRLAQLEQGLRFPNQMVYRDGSLYLANTNRHEISVFDTTGDGLERRPESSFRTDPNGAGLGQHVWPSALLLLDREIWVINADNGMANGLGLRFSPQGKLLGRLPAPEGADLFSLIRLGDQVLASDYANNRIQRFGLDGSYLGPFDAGALDQRIAALESQRAERRRWMQILIGLFVAALAAGTVVGVRQQIRDLPPAAPAADRGEQRPIHVRPDTRWIDPEPQIRRQLVANWIMFGFLVLVLVLVLWYLPGRTPNQLLTVYGIGLLWLGAFAWMQVGLSRQRIGVDGGLLILRDGAGRYAVGKGASILYAPTHVMIDGVAVWLRAPVPVFSQEQMLRLVYPLLKDAQSLSHQEMQWLLIKLHPYRSATMALSVSLLIGLIWWR